MTEAVSLLLTNCENDTPPFDNVIRTALSSLQQSRFQFALELQQTFDSKKDALSPTQQLCILCAIQNIGNGFGTSVSEWEDVSQNVFGEFLLKHQEDLADALSRISYTGQLPLMQVLNRAKNKELDGTTRPMSPPALLYDPCIVDTLEQQQAFHIKFHRPLPPFVCNQMLEEKQIDWPELNLRFLHTTYPSLRYQWMSSTMMQLQLDDSFHVHDDVESDENLSMAYSNVEGLLQKIFQEPLDLEEEAAVLNYCQVKGIGVGIGIETGAGAGTGIETTCNQNKPPQFVITLDNLSMVVEHNPNIAFELLLAMQDDEVAAKFHSKLVNMEVTLNTMEVVYKLATATSAATAVEDGIRVEGTRSDAKPKVTKDVSMPKMGANTRVPCKLNAEYLNIFILGLFERCATSQDRKMVRLVSVFLQNLIQNGIVQVDDLVSAQVQAFCIENSRVREAQVLFKLLKDKSDTGNRGMSLFDGGRRMAGTIGGGGGSGGGGGRELTTASNNIGSSGGGSSNSMKVKKSNEKARKK